MRRKTNFRRALQTLLLLAAAGNSTAFAEDKKQGFDGYTFGMPIDEAAKVRPEAVRGTSCDYKGVLACLQYKTKIALYPATVTVEARNPELLVDKIVVTVESLEKPPKFSCIIIRNDLMKYLVAQYGGHFIVQDRIPYWNSAENGVVSLSSVCAEDVGVNIVAFISGAPPRQK